MEASTESGRPRTQALCQVVDAAVAALIDGRPVIVVGTSLAGTTTVVDDLREHGAGPFLVVALTPGTGPAPDAPSLVTESGEGAESDRLASVADEIRAVDDLVHRPAPAVLDAVDRFDPERRALVYLNVFTGHDGRVFGRSTLGGRPRAFERLEDKTLSRTLWESAGVAHAPEEVVACRADDLANAARRLDDGAGTVWSADASTGMNGGADRVHRVTDPASAERALTALAPVSRRVRVMPFLEGVPCSIHALVLPDGIVVLRPVELIMLRTPGSDRFVYAGCATGWDPPEEVRASMRSTARSVAENLAQQHGYRGALGIDGIVTRRGYLPTELNPRFSGGIANLAKGIPEIPLRWVHTLALHEIDLGVHADVVEQSVLAAADTHRAGAIYTVTHAPAPAPGTTRVRLGAADGVPDGDLEIGPAAHGRMVRFVPDEVPAGIRLAPVATAAFVAADRRWGTGLGDLRAAPEVGSDDDPRWRHRDTDPDDARRTGPRY